MFPLALIQPLAADGARGLHEVGIEERVRDAKLGKAVLRRSQHLSRTAKLQIFFRQAKPVGDGREETEPLPGKLPRIARHGEHAAARPFRAADASAELMELRET